jgi:hypothetical protein
LNPPSKSSSPAKAGDPVFQSVNDERLRRTGYPAFAGYDDNICSCSEHPVADRKGVVQRVGRQFGRVRRADEIGEVPRAELIGAAWVCRQPPALSAMPLRNEIKGWANPARSAMPLENEEIGFITISRGCLEAE